MKEDINEVCKKVFKYESSTGCKESDCLTYWYGDYNIYVPKFGVTEEQVIAKCHQIKSLIQ